MKFGLRPYLERFLGWLSIGKVGVILLFLAIPGVLLAYRAEQRAFSPGDLLEFSYNQFSWEIASIAFTILIIDRLYHVQEIRQEKRQLIRQLRSNDIHLVREAADRLRTQGWLADGTLRGINLHGAILRHVNWQTADLTDATLEKTDLRSIDLSHAKLTNTHMSDADLSNAHLNGAEVKDEQLQNVARLAHAIMPDGTKYDGRFQLSGDLREARTNGYNLQDPVSMARYYDVAISEATMHN